MARRKQLGKQYSCNSIFSAKLVCSICGNFYGSKVWHSTSKYKRTIWQCNYKFQGENKCSTPNINEDAIKQKFLVAINQLIKNRDEIIENCRLIQSALTDCSSIDTQLSELKQELDIVAELTRKCIEENAYSALSQEEYMSRYNSYAKRYETAKARIVELKTLRQERLTKKNNVEIFISELKKRELLLDEFDDGLWVAVIEKVMVYEDRLIFEFRNGLGIEAEL